MTESDEVSSALDELLPFLDVLTPAQYKEKILEQLLGMTGTADGIRSITNNLRMIDKFTDLICNDKDNKTRIDCLKILVNMTCGSIPKQIEDKIMADYFVCFLLRVLTVEDADSADSAAMLLSNITQEQQHCHIVFKCINNDDLVTFDKLIDVFCMENFNKHCQLHHVGTLLSNLTMLHEVREIMVNKEKRIICRMLPFTQYDKSATRRLAAATIIKNCLFNTEYHTWLLSEDVEIIPHLLLPLAGPEEFSVEENDELPLDLQYLPADKKREINQEILILLLESLFQLCATKDCRLKMKKNGSYYILREFHKVVDEENIALMYPLENLVQILIGDEPEQKEHNNLKEILIPPHIAKTFENVG